MSPLNDEQKQLVAEHMFVIDQVIRNKRRLLDSSDHDELFNVGYLALVRASQQNSPAIKNFIGYAYRAVWYEIIKFRTTKTPVPTEDLGCELSRDDGRDEQAMIDHRLDLESTLERLGEKEKRLLELRLVHGKSYEEIGTELGVTTNAAKGLINRAINTVFDSLPISGPQHRSKRRRREASE